MKQKELLYILKNVAVPVPEQVPVIGPYSAKLYDAEPPEAAASQSDPPIKPDVQSVEPAGIAAQFAGRAPEKKIIWNVDGNRVSITSTLAFRSAVDSWIVISHLLSFCDRRERRSGARHPDDADRGDDRQLLWLVVAHSSASRSTNEEMIVRRMGSETSSFIVRW
jgi:hypothetical protein